MPAVCLGVLLAATGADRLQGQVTQSTILGTVSDASGALVPGAEITVKNERTNIERSMLTNEAGDYRIAGLEAGFYEVTIRQAGFKTFTRTRIDLNSSQIKRVDAVLEVGDTATTVTVEGGTSQIETEQVSLSNVKTGRDYTELPLSIYGRGWANVTNVTAGIQSRQCCDFLVNGGRGSANNFSADGISASLPLQSAQGPNGFIAGDVENLQEVKIITANTSAEYPSVAQFAAVTKSGSNELHGAFYWGNFNNKFSARAWHDTQSPEFTNHNMFMVNNGGPVYIPGLYNGRDKTFYFFNYSGARYRVGNRNFVSVPTPEFRQGNFSALIAPSVPEADRIVVRDPLTGDPFPNNTIPSSRISSVSQAVQNIIYPSPNAVGQGIYGLDRNFFGDPGGRFDSDVVSGRLDHKLTDNNFLFGRFSYVVNNKDAYPGVLNEGYGEGAWRGNHPGQNLVLSDTHTFGPNLVNEFKAGYSRDFGFWFDPNAGPDIVGQIGLQGINNPSNDPALSGMPAFSFPGVINFHGTSTWANGNHQAQNTFQLIDNVSWFRGRHNFKFGGEFRRFQVNDRVAPQSMRGGFSFDDRLSGFNYANFLLGYLSSATRSLPRPNAYPRDWITGFYFQDDFKISNRVTLNYGLRYEYQSPWTEKFDRMFTFDPSTGAMVTAGSAIPTDLVPAVAQTLTIVPASQAGFPVRSLMETDGNNFSPRVGLAFRPFADADTVIRAGWGLYTTPWPGSIGLRATGGPWQSQEDFILESEDTPTITFPNPFLATSDFSGIQNIAGVSRNFPNERTQQWSLSVGRQIWGTAVDIGYVGTRALNIPYTENLNLLRPSTIPFDLARRPYPRYSAANLTQAGGSSIYHALTIQANRRLSRGLWYNVNYTWAKALTDVELGGFAPMPQQNQYQRFLERADEPRHRRQQFRFSYGYELPFGRGKRYLNALHPVANGILGGWQIAGITTMLTGQRLSPSFSGTDPANTNQFGGRPDRIGDGNFDSGEMRDRIKSQTPIFDRNAFALPETGRGFYGNSARYILTGPGEVVWNTVLSKNFYFAERARMQFRWEAFNAFNRPNFNNPNTNIGSGAFGLVTSAGSARAMLFGLRLDY
ncbi:MAG: carboxypeptidase regulatory-like domain-containing protein [Bryobacteraceae bacterium]|nr:carboxypeptidase regulatory-like domain-containing protein [Bryobacteraceae bacterium]